MSIITVSSRPIAAPLMVMVLILVLLIFSNLLPCFLSSSSFTVTHVPGFPNALPFRLETGYVTVNEESGGELFYYFVESERNPGEDPLILWLLGGPGCSAINGLALDMGPIRFNVDDFDGRLPTLVVNPHAWTKVANMIFVDWPYGTGYSYSKNKEEYVTDDMRTVKLMYKFLRKWLHDHPTFLSNTFYMGGDSYGAKMAVHMAYDIVEANEAGHVPLINIKGYVVGNAVTGEKIDTSTQALHAYGLGVISKELYELVDKNCVGEDYYKPKNPVCAAHLDSFYRFLSEINSYGVSDANCPDEPSIIENLENARSLKENSAYTHSSSSVPNTSCITAELLANYWGNHYRVRQALHVKEGTTGRFHRCNFDLNTNYARNRPSSVPEHHSLTSRGYRALVYNGDHDLRIPYLGSLEWIKSLNYTVLEPWRSWYAEGQVAGYTMLFSNNLTFATIKGGNHVAPGKMPLQCFAMFERWISHRGL